MEITNISEAKATLSKLVEKVIGGEEVIIAKAGKPVAKLIPYHLDSEPRKLGVGNWKGNIWIAEDFDESSDEILALFMGDDDNDESAS
jgi:prevent-host-death family protein